MADVFVDPSVVSTDIRPSRALFASTESALPQNRLRGTSSGPSADIGDRKRSGAAVPDQRWLAGSSIRLTRGRSRRTELRQCEVGVLVVAAVDVVTLFEIGRRPSLQRPELVSPTTTASSPAASGEPVNARRARSSRLTPCWPRRLRNSGRQPTGNHQRTGRDQKISGEHSPRSSRGKCQGREP